MDRKVSALSKSLLVFYSQKRFVGRLWLVLLIFSLCFIALEVEAKQDTWVDFELNQIFPRPDKLNVKIDFWHDIFTVYPSDKVVIHDSWYLDVIYEVLDVEGVAEDEARELSRATRKRYAELIGKVIDGWESPNLMTPEERRVYRLLSNTKESPYYPIANAGQRVRSQRGCADKFKEGLIRSGRYTKFMKQVFREKGLPEQLVYLPMIESTFNPGATSHAGAAGMWQFMQGTGAMYGLRVNRYLDERRDPVKATYAAAKLLADNYRTLGTWPLAITAYNHGRQGMINAVKDVESTDIEHIVERYAGRRFSFASRNFYVEFLAAVDICSNYKKHFGNITFDPPLSLAQVDLKAGVSIKQLEKISGLEQSIIHELNPALKSPFFIQGASFPQTYQLNLPNHKAGIVNQQLASLFEAPLPLNPNISRTMERHIVKQGETLIQIANHYNTSVDKIIKANSIRNPNRLRYRQRLIIPQEKPVIKQAAVKKPAVKQQKTKKYLVQKGQTLSVIAKKFNTSIQELSRLNNINDPCKIVSGSWLLVPEG